MSDLAYWISPNFKIMEVGARNHIEMILQNPKLFGLTDDYVRKIYKLEREPIGFEGKAREKIMLNLIKIGWIRCRYFVRDGEWHCQGNKINKRMLESIWDWSVEVLEGGKGNASSKFTPVHVIGIFDDKVLDSTLGEIAKGNLLEMKSKAKKSKLSLIDCINKKE